MLTSRQRAELLYLDLGTLHISLRAHYSWNIYINILDYSKNRTSWMCVHFNSFQAAWWNKSSWWLEKVPNSRFYYHTVTVHIAEWWIIEKPNTQQWVRTSSVVLTVVDHRTEPINNPCDAVWWRVFIENWKALYQKTLTCDQTAVGRDDCLDYWHVLPR